jgi:hypothetical protein
MNVLPQPLSVLPNRPYMLIANVLFGKHRNRVETTDLRL